MSDGAQVTPAGSMPRSTEYFVSRRRASSETPDSYDYAFELADFGVAKATGQQLTDRTMFTGFGDVIGTLEHMSPEITRRRKCYRRFRCAVVSELLVVTGNPLNRIGFESLDQFPICAADRRIGSAALGRISRNFSTERSPRFPAAAHARMYRTIARMHARKTSCN